MHRIAATPGGWNPDTDGVIIIEQTPASIIFLSSADTDIQTLAATLPSLPPEFPSIRAVNLLQLQQPFSIDSYADTVLSKAKIIILRLLGGRSYWSYGLEVVKEIAEQNNIVLFVLPGDDHPDTTLMSHSTVALSIVTQLWRYLTEGGIENYCNGLKYTSDTCLGSSYYPPSPQIVPKVGIYKESKIGKRVGILFYRSHYLSGNTLPIDHLCLALEKNYLAPVAIFVSSLRDTEVQEEIWQYFCTKSEPVQIILNTTSFSISQLSAEIDVDHTYYQNYWTRFNVSVLQVILSGGTETEWENSFKGLSPRDVAMNVALPEVDGRIITKAISFKSVQKGDEKLETDVVIYQPREDRIKFIAELTANWVKLKNTSPEQRKIAIILANYPNRDGRIANGVGLDTPASCINILHALQDAGYSLTDIPNNGDELIQKLTTGVTNDLEGKELRSVYQSLSVDEYLTYFQTLPPTVQQEMINRWGIIQNQTIPISGLQLDQIFIGIQPSRGYDLDPSLNYHAPDLEPTHEYLAYYYWLRQNFDAIIHLGKHGNLEWLPGKSIALSNECYPEITLSTLPHFYPFIVNDPGEGSQAKRRAHAVIIDHLTPPMTRAELYGDLQKLEALIDEYYEAQQLDPSRLKLISDRISQLITESHLKEDLNIQAITSELLTKVDGYLCELKEAQIRDGLHIFGQCPENVQLRDLILSIARSPSTNRLGLTRAIAQDLDLCFDPLTVKPDELLSKSEKLPNCRTTGDAIAFLETTASKLIENLLFLDELGDGLEDGLEDGFEDGFRNGSGDGFEDGFGDQTPTIGKNTYIELNWIKTSLLPALQKTTHELTYLLAGLNGEYVPSGASGAPTRGRPDVLPTGRNFYSVDIRCIPTETAWDVGRKAAENLIEKYTQEQGEYPQTLAISIWGTSTMRTGGEDLSQVLALLGIQPVWDGISRRVVNYEILTPSALGRPRIDVVVRVSGFFRDSFPNLLHMLNSAINQLACQEEEKEINPLAAKVQTESEFWENQGLTKEQAKLRASYRIFGSKPGAYGAGLQGLIESQNWENDDDLARAYMNWSCYAYDEKGIGHHVPETFKTRLQELQIVLQNQDNREHDLLDSDDYYQFQGGLTASVRSLTGKNPIVYFGDNSVPSNPKVKTLQEEITKVYRSRVINPKWIAGVMRHGYKGAFEMSATVDYLFAYDATTRCVEDYMYQGIAQAYIFDETVQQFIQTKNPWALRDMAERLLEAHQRGLWEKVDPSVLEKLRASVHQAEGVIEGKNA
ncbi:cobaltochelatase subunit CobN [Aphanothece hegewaldii CCALA 016]|uniref:Cobaltochelatase subunit CobN n=1 Tax=Aphanothece hegewaldii CCALA 016 TaxID=2107694 RepID=A0A2T1LW35_9CHRO|nr:cobaltochelatase subunit CobN [Aphanothece hegewaldii]PSF36111.1 cobaltochelatase subunit CobN [Aphanothece hegewaldii CCALA 016]